jgi:hypothetical protein
MKLCRSARRCRGGGCRWMMRIGWGIRLRVDGPDAGDQHQTQFTTDSFHIADHIAAPPSFVGISGELPFRPSPRTPRTGEPSAARAAARTGSASRTSRRRRTNRPTGVAP